MKKLTLMRWLILGAAITSIYACGNAVGKATGKSDDPPPLKDSGAHINIDATVEAKLALIAAESTAEAKLSERPANSPTPRGATLNTTTLLSLIHI